MLWGLGGTVVIYLAALQQVPKDLYEAAQLDGAGSFARFRRITLPMISGTLFFTMIVLTIHSLQMFDQAYTMFFGGQQNSTYANGAALFYVIYLFQQAFGVLHMGYASADLEHAGELSDQPPAGSGAERAGLGLLRRLPYLAVLLLASVLFLYPLVWLASASLKPRTEVFDNSLLPHHWRWANYSNVTTPRCCCRWPTA